MTQEWGLNRLAARCCRLLNPAFPPLPSLLPQSRNISLAYGVKHDTLERLSRCMGVKVMRGGPAEGACACQRRGGGMDAQGSLSCVANIQYAARRPGLCARLQILPTIEHLTSQNAHMYLGDCKVFKMEVLAPTPAPVPAPAAAAAAAEAAGPGPGGSASGSSASGSSLPSGIETPATPAQQSLPPLMPVPADQQQQQHAAGLAGTSSSISFQSLAALKLADSLGSGPGAAAAVASVSGGLVAHPPVQPPSAAASSGAGAAAQGPASGGFGAVAPKVGAAGGKPV